MQYTYEMYMLDKVYPNTFSRAQMEAIRQYWRVFYDKPEKYKGTTLETLVFEWLENEDGKKVVKGWEEAFRI